MNAHLAVVGLGYIGLPTSIVFANAGVRVTGVDISSHTLTEVHEGRVPFDEPHLQEALHRALGSGNLHVQREMPHADAYIVAVPTPNDANHQPDLRAVNAAIDSIIPVLRGGEMIIIESTIPPATTRNAYERIIATRPELADRIDMAHVPERVLPGKIMEEIYANDRLAGGLTPQAAERAKALYARFSEGKIKVTDATTAELTKLAENSFRDVNIAFANELSLICDKLGVNAYELISLANMHPRVNILNPGPGVGGHCVAVDPWFIVAADPEQARLIRTAREVNDSKPMWVVNTALKKLQEPGNIALLGLTFKADVDDVRESPAMEIAAQLAEFPLVQSVIAVDPHLDALPSTLTGSGKIRLAPLDEALGADVVIIAVPHAPFRHARHQIAEHPAVVDACGVLNTPTELAR